AGMREHFGDYQRQLFLMDHAGLPLKTVLEQLDFLGGEVVPVLRRELEVNRPVGISDGPTHASLVAARDAAEVAAAASLVAEADASSASAVDSLASASTSEGR
ncbi:MAG: hypothetical protein JWR01_2296, partial [Subtercola sp.]|nr:hypothetical protein [Subtercola sp.]